MARNAWVHRPALREGEDLDSGRAATRAHAQGHGGPRVGSLIPFLGFYVPL